MAKPKYDYDGKEFYSKIKASAERQMRTSHIVRDADIAHDLNILPQTFSEMKTGQYRRWAKDANERRGKRIAELLRHAKCACEDEIWMTIADLATGRAHAKDTTYYIVKDKVTGAKKIVEHELPPSLPALQLWMKHNSPEFRHIEEGTEGNDKEVPENIKHGISITDWIKMEVGHDKDKEDGE